MHPQGRTALPRGRLVKVAKPQQDMRFDVPTIGLHTLQTLVAAKGRVLAIEAGKTIVVNEAEVVDFANRHGITIVALEAEGNCQQLIDSEPNSAAA
jgi:DUF1009 family protein